MSVEFNLTLALQQESKAKEYYQLYCNGEMEISDEDLQALQNQYKGKIEHWKPEETTDQNQYTIEDEEKDSGVGGFLARSVPGILGLEGSAIIGGSKIGIIGCLLAFASGLAYALTDPNKTEHKELMELKDIMESKIAEMETATNDMGVTQKEIADILAEYGNDKDAIAAAIEEKTQELNTLKEERQALLDKVDSGEMLSEEEKAKFDELNGQIGALSHEINVLNSALVEETEDTEGEVASEEETYEEANNLAISAEEAAEKASEFDEETKANAILEASMQGANIIGGTLSIISATPQIAVNPFAAAAVALGYTGVAMSTAGVIDQTKIASDVSKEIDIRKSAFGNAANLSTNAEDGLTNVDKSINDINEKLPEVEEVEEEPEIPAEFSVQPQQGEESESGQEVNPEDPKKKPEDV